MTATDLFGNQINRPTAPLLDAEYQTYIQSAPWKAKRKQKLVDAHNACEKCGISGYSARLEVHHRHYDTFKHERMEDLQVLCPKCHETADEKRVERSEQNQEERLHYARLDGWAVKKYGEDWRFSQDVGRIEIEFLEYLEEQELKDYLE